MEAQKCTLIHFHVLLGNEQKTTPALGRGPRHLHGRTRPGSDRPVPSRSRWPVPGEGTAESSGRGGVSPAGRSWPRSRLAVQARAGGRTSRRARCDSMPQHQLSFVDEATLLAVLDRTAEDHFFVGEDWRMKIDTACTLVTTDYTVLKAALDLQMKHGLCGVEQLFLRCCARLARGKVHADRHRLGRRRAVGLGGREPRHGPARRRASQTSASARHGPHGGLIGWQRRGARLLPFSPAPRRVAFCAARPCCRAPSAMGAPAPSRPPGSLSVENVRRFAVDLAVETLLLHRVGHAHRSNMSMTLRISHVPTNEYVATMATAATWTPRNFAFPAAARRPRPR